MRIVNDDGTFYVQQPAKDYRAQTGITSASHDATLCKFKDNIYRGPHGFETLEQAEAKVQEIKSGLDVSYIPNKAHSNLNSEI